MNQFSPTRSDPMLQPISSPTERIALYSAVDDTLTHFEVHPETGSLTQHGSITIKAKVQYAWKHPQLPRLYVSSSNGGPHKVSDCNHVSAFTIECDGSLTPLGQDAVLDRRAVHMCIDPSGRFAINAHNYPVCGLSVHALNQDGLIQEKLPEVSHLQFGIYPHQVMTFPSGQHVMIVDRGNKASADKPEEPGALRTYRFDNGILSQAQVVAPHGGFGFGPRHVSFHPKAPWVYVCDERFNRLYMFRFKDDQLEHQAAYCQEILMQPNLVRPRQIAGPIHVHPKGHVVYVANRSDHSIEENGVNVFNGGENNIAVYQINPESGRPDLIQHIDTQSFHVRTFAIDPNGRFLITASIKPLSIKKEGGLEVIPARLTVFRILVDGQLEFLSTHDIATTGHQMQYWVGAANTV